MTLRRGQLADRPRDLRKKIEDIHVNQAQQAHDDDQNDSAHDRVFRDTLPVFRFESRNKHLLVRKTETNMHTPCTGYAHLSLLEEFVEKRNSTNVRKGFGPESFRLSPNAARDFKLASSRAGQSVPTPSSLLREGGVLTS